MVTTVLGVRSLREFVYSLVSVCIIPGSPHLDLLQETGGLSFQDRIRSAGGTCSSPTSVAPFLHIEWGSHVLTQPHL